jgi:hypothetical protein
MVYFSKPPAKEMIAYFIKVISALYFPQFRKIYMNWIFKRRPIPSQ